MIRVVTEPSRPQGDAASPFFAPRAGPAALCLHGLTSTPFETVPVARALSTAGFSVSAPLLAGHGVDAATLGRTRWQDWLASAEAGFEELRAASGGGPMALIGFSMGGLLALRLARLRPTEVSALVVASAPLRLRPWQSAAVKAWRRLPRFLRRGRLAALRKKNGSDVTDESVRRENPGLREMPLAAVAELVALGGIVRRDLPFIRQPTLVAHGQRDQTVALQCSYELAGCIASDIVEQLWLPRSGHLLGVDVERNQLASVVVRFLRRHLPSMAAVPKEASPA